MPRHCQGPTQSACRWGLHWQSVKAQSENKPWAKHKESPGKVSFGILQALEGCWFHQRVTARRIWRKRVGFVDPIQDVHNILWYVDILGLILEIADFQKFDFFGKRSSFPRCLRFQGFWDPKVQVFVEWRFWSWIPAWWVRELGAKPSDNSPCWSHNVASFVTAPHDQSKDPSSGTEIWCAETVLYQ